MTPRPQLDHNAAGRPGADLLIRGARLLDPAANIDETADLLVRGGEIAQIGQDLERPDGGEVVDADGLHAFPAFVDPHVHLRTPGREDEEDIESGTRAAAAGGYCAIIAQPNTDPVVDSASIVESLRERARAEARVPTGFMAAITRGQKSEQLTEMAELAATGAFGFTDDGLPVVSAGVLRQALQYQRLAGLPIALHEEDPSLSAGGAMHEGAVSALLGIGGIPSISESTMIARDAAIAGYEGGRIHIQHVSARESVVAVEQAKQAGVAITAEVSPHHLTLTDEAVRALDANFKMNPPLRAEADRQALIDALRSGAMDFIATDHAPHSREEKEQPFETAPFGITGLETAFSVLYTALVKPGVVPLELIVAKLSAGAPAFGIDLPTLAPGAEANITLVDLDAEWQVGEAGYESRSANSAWAGETLSARVRMTVAAGGVAYRERSFAIGAVA
jgi:dihydroorotase